ncbi:MAG: hypothetical protein GX555_13900 [Actinomycetales bacterium]|nr:hypothetical protein [Actinomycetales bacterium]
MNDVFRRDPANLAPSIDRQWADDFILEQRMLDVPGTRIGDALATIESHVVDSGESAQEAFGGATDYARELAEVGGIGADGDRVGTLTVLSSMLGLVGMLMTTQAFSAWLDGADARISLGFLTVGAVALVALGVFLARPTAFLRLVVERFWLAALVPFLVLGAAVALALVVPDVAFSVPTLLLGGLGVLLLGTSAVISWRDNPEADAVLAPGEASPETTPGRLRLALFLPGLTLLVLGVLWVMHAIT